MNQHALDGIVRRHTLDDLEAGVGPDVGIDLEAVLLAQHGDGGDVLALFAGEAPVGHGR